VFKVVLANELDVAAAASAEETVRSIEAYLAGNWQIPKVDVNLAVPHELEQDKVKKFAAESCPPARLDLRARPVVAVTRSVVEDPLTGVVRVTAQLLTVMAVVPEKKAVLTSAWLA